MGSVPGADSERKAVRRFTWLLLGLLLALALLNGTLEFSDGGAAGSEQLLHRSVPQAPSPVSATGQLAEVYESAREATVRIESRCSSSIFGETPIDVGSGYFVSSGGHLLTAYHVIRRQALPPPSHCALRYVAIDAERREFPLELVGFDAFLDVAMLRAQVNGPVPYLPLADAPPEIGSEVLAIGNSRGQFLADRVGSVTRLGVRAGQPDFASGTMELTAALAPGDSGGPVIDGDGRALGVVSYISFDPSVLVAEGESALGRLLPDSNAPRFASYAVPLLEGSGVLASLRAGERRDVPVIGFEVAFEYDPRVRAGPSLGRRPGVVVGRVREKGPAAAAGLRSLREQALLDERGRAVATTMTGDVIVAVDGRPTPTFETLLARVREKDVGQRVVLTVQRGTASEELAVELAGYRQVFR